MYVCWEEKGGRKSLNAVKMILILVLSLFAICGAVMPRIEVDGSGGIGVFEEMNEDYYSNRLGDDLDSVELTLDEMSGSGEGLDGTRVQQLMGSDYVAGFDDPIFEGELDEEDKKDLEMLTKVKSLRSVGQLVESKSITQLYLLLNLGSGCQSCTTQRVINLTELQFISGIINRRDSQKSQKSAASISAWNSKKWSVLTNFESSKLTREKGPNTFKTLQMKKLEKELEGEEGGTVNRMTVMNRMPQINQSTITLCPWSTSHVPKCDPKAKYRRIDGSCNHPTNPFYGKADAPFNRLVKANYAGKSEKYKNFINTCCKFDFRWAKQIEGICERRRAPERKEDNR